MGLSKHIAEHAVLGVGANVIAPSDSLTITVGVNGDYATLGEALDYIETQTTFESVTGASVDLPVFAKSFNQMSSEVLLFDNATPVPANYWNPGTAPPTQTQLYWFQLNGDSLWYPLQSYQYDTGAGIQKLSARTRRPEVSNASGVSDIAVTWQQAIQWQIILLDKETDVGGDHALSKPLVVEITGAIHSTITNGSITFDDTNAPYGRVTFINCENPRCLNVSSNGTVALFEAEHFDCSFSIAGGDFWGPPARVYGTFEMHRCKFNHRQANSGVQHIINISTYGDMIFNDIAFTDTPLLKSIGGNKTDLAFLDYCAARNIIINNFNATLHYELSDLVSYFSLCERMGGHTTIAGQLTAAATHFIGSNILLSAQGNQTGLIPKLNILSWDQTAAGAVGTLTGSLLNCGISSVNCTENLITNNANETFTIDIQDCVGNISLNTNGAVNVKSANPGAQSTGAGSAALGANCPAATTAAPNTWKAITLTDGSTGFIPVWK